MVKELASSYTTPPVTVATLVITLFFEKFLVPQQGPTDFGLFA